jgi:hypothetical protein
LQRGGTIGRQAIDVKASYFRRHGSAHTQSAVATDGKLNFNIIKFLDKTDDRTHAITEKFIGS